MKSYILNEETQRIELHFTREEYKALAEDQKKEIKSAYLFSRKAGAWVSRSTKNHWRAIEVAKQLGFTDGATVGERLSFEEELNRKAEKADARAQRYGQYAANAEKRAAGLQSELNSMHGDIAFFTQPDINTAGGRSFTNYRKKIFDRYGKGFEEYRKSDYFKEKAATAAKTANMEKLKDRTYLSNRIIECQKIIKRFEGYLTTAEEKQQNGDTVVADRMKKYAAEIEYQGDKMAFMQNCLDALGTIYTRENIKKGNFVKVRGDYREVIRANQKTVTVKCLMNGSSYFPLKYAYEEIQDVKTGIDN